MSAFRVDEVSDGRYVSLKIIRPDLEVDRTSVAQAVRDWPIDDYLLTNDEAADLYALLRAQIGEWAAERDAARRAVADGVSLQDFAGIAPEEADIEDGIEIVLEGRYVERYLDAADHERKARRENG